MPFYVQRGNVPEKRHIQHRSESGKLYYEEHISRCGFSDIYSNVHHIHLPTKIMKVDEFTPIELKPSTDPVHRHRHLETFQLPFAGNWVFDRHPLMFNSDVVLSIANPVDNPDFFYRNGDADEVIFVHYGKGVVHSSFGKMDFGPGDYIVIPKGVLYKLELQEKEHRLLIMESKGPVETPNRYRNVHGQLLEHAPYCERDFRVPEFVEAIDEEKGHVLYVKLAHGIQKYTLSHHPFDVVGWDGYYYPWIFNIRDFMPIVGKIHLPPPVHQTFQAPGFVICSFVPRLFDFHEKSVPAPYNHSNVDSDEVLYYVEGEFMSRKGVGLGSITLHPYGLPHGPQPGKTEASLGMKETKEYAVMLDTFKPLYVTENALKIDDPKYPYSWMEQ